MIYVEPLLVCVVSLCLSPSQSWQWSVEELPVQFMMKMLWMYTSWACNVNGISSFNMQVMANADTPEDALAARNNGAEGIGLCRTEHMVRGCWWLQGGFWELVNFRNIYSHKIQFTLPLKLSILKCKASKETRVYTKVKHTTRINYVIRLLKHFRGNVLVAICQPVHLSDVGFFELWICCYAVLCIWSENQSSETNDHGNNNSSASSSPWQVASLPALRFWRHFQGDGWYVIVLVRWCLLVVYVGCPFLNQLIWIHFWKWQTTLWLPDGTGVISALGGWQFVQKVVTCYLQIYTSLNHQNEHFL